MKKATTTRLQLELENRINRFALDLIDRVTAFEAIFIIDTFTNTVCQLASLEQHIPISLEGLTASEKENLRQKLGLESLTELSELFPAKE